MPHYLDECNQLSKRPENESLEFMSQKEQLSKECTKKRTYRICKGKHLIALYRQSSPSVKFKQGIKDIANNCGNLVKMNDQKEEKKDDVAHISSGDGENDLHNLVKAMPKE